MSVYCSNQDTIQNCHFWPPVKSAITLHAWYVRPRSGKAWGACVHGSYFFLFWEKRFSQLRRKTTLARLQADDSENHQNILRVKRRLDLWTNNRLSFLDLCQQELHTLINQYKNHVSVGTTECDQSLTPGAFARTRALGQRGPPSHATALLVCHCRRPQPPQVLPPVGICGGPI